MKHDHEVTEKEKLLYSKWKTDQIFVNRINRFRIVDDSEISETINNTSLTSCENLLDSNQLLMRPPPAKPKILSKPKLVWPIVSKLKPVIKPRSKSVMPTNSDEVYKDLKNQKTFLNNLISEKNEDWLQIDKNSNYVELFQLNKNQTWRFLNKPLPYSNFSVCKNKNLNLPVYESNFLCQKNTISKNIPVNNLATSNLTTSMPISIPSFSKNVPPISVVNPQRDVYGNIHVNVPNLSELKLQNTKNNAAELDNSVIKNLKQKPLTLKTFNNKPDLLENQKKITKPLNKEILATESTEFNMNNKKNKTDLFKCTMKKKKTKKLNVEDNLIFNIQQKQKELLKKRFKKKKEINEKDKLNIIEETFILKKKNFKSNKVNRIIQNKTEKKNLSMLIENETIQNTIDSENFFNNNLLNTTNYEPFIDLDDKEAILKYENITEKTLFNETPQTKMSISIKKEPLNEKKEFSTNLKEVCLNKKSKNNTKNQQISLQFPDNTKIFENKKFNLKETNKITENLTKQKDIKVEVIDSIDQVLDCYSKPMRPLNTYESQMMCKINELQATVIDLQKQLKEVTNERDKLQSERDIIRQKRQELINFVNASIGNLSDL